MFELILGDAVNSPTYPTWNKHRKIHHVSWTKWMLQLCLESWSLQLLLDDVEKWNLQKSVVVFQHWCLQKELNEDFSHGTRG